MAKATSSKKSKTSKSAVKTAKRTKSRKTVKGAENGDEASPAPSAPRRPASTGDGIFVRMYRGLLGDFFLVRHVKGERTFKMLIDCGVLQCIGKKENKPSTALGKERIRAGVANMLEDVDGEIDLVVATHEHYDHLSGFIHANDLYEPVRIGKVWMAWTEDRTDKQANAYRNKRVKAVKALAALARNNAFAATREIETVTNLLQFYGDFDAIDSESMGMAARGEGTKVPGNASCELVLDWLKRRAGTSNVEYLEPGQVVRWGVDDAFRAYVLGPPREHDLLKQLNPKKGEGREVYLARGQDVETVSSLAALHGNDGDFDSLQDLPFARLHWRKYRDKKDSYGGDPIVALYEDPNSKARRIDLEFLGSAEDLALKIDGDVNNTSLALALELAGKEILLLAADAQVGNWLSWGDQTYPASEQKDAQQLKIDDLLGRAIFYKVGHHASHNATLRERGLELMTDPRLVAMIPVVEETAAEQATKNAPNGWAMPYDHLYERLEELTEGRILQGDGTPASEKEKFEHSLFELGYGPNYATGDPLWVELHLPA